MKTLRLPFLSAFAVCSLLAACTGGDASESGSPASGTQLPDGSRDDPDGDGTQGTGTGIGNAGGSTSGGGKGGSSSGKGGGSGKGGSSNGAAGSIAVGSGGGAGSGTYGAAGGAGSSAGMPTPPLPPPPKEPPPEPAIVTCEELDKEKAATFYLSADDSNSMASPVMARHALQAGNFNHAGRIRTYEFLNYYNVAFEQPTEGNLAIVPQVREGDAPGTLSLQIGVQSGVSVGVRRPATLTFVLDTSGSMQGTPLANQRHSMHAIAKKLQAGDIVSIVTWDTKNRIEMSGHAITGPNDPKLLAVVDKLSASGGTDLNGGLTAGYDLAQKHFGANRINRVVVISDGIANVGVTEEKLIGQHANDNDKEGIYLVGVAVGEGFNDTLLNVVTDAGNGAYLYVDSEEEADKMLDERFAETFQVAARDVRVRADFPWYFQVKEFFGEEYSTDPAKVKPQHLAPGDAMVFNQVLGACDASAIKDADPFSFTVTWADPISYEEKTVSKTISLGELRAAGKRELQKGEAIVAYAEALKHPSPTARKTAASAAFAKVITADPQGVDPALNEIKELLTLLQK